MVLHPKKATNAPRNAAIAAFAEIMARVRKYPAISYLIISVLPLIPGSSIYYTALGAMQGDMDRFIYYGTETLGTAGAMAVGILLVSTVMRIRNSRHAARQLLPK